MKGLNKKSGLGTILEAINEYVKSEYKFRPPKLRRDDEDLDLDDTAIEDATKKAEKNIKAEAKFMEEQSKKMLKPDESAA
jgi:hypothetical protein